MKINKNQALYRALPNSWITYSDSTKSDYKYACEVSVWNTKKVTGINEDIIKEEIYRKVRSFNNACGSVSDEFTKDSINEFEFVEASMNDGIPDITCRINPPTFYCQKCNSVIYKPFAVEAPYCNFCSKDINKQKTNQLQMVYACECGYAEGVKPIADKNERVFYHSRDKENQFKFFTKSSRKIEMKMLCPICNKTLFPKNAMDSRLFYTQSGNIVNLYNEKYADALKRYKFDAEILMLAKWFDLIDNEVFLKILEEPVNYFEFKSKKTDDLEIQTLAKAFGKTPEEIVSILSSEETTRCINNTKKEINSIIPLETIEKEKVRIITSNLIEFDTVKYPKESISLNEAIEKNIETGSIIDERDITELLNKLHISKIQVSEQVQIVNYAFGFTRLRSCPDGSDATSNIRLRGFNNKVFTTILETEGILIEIDMISVYNWLVDNKIIDDDIIIVSQKDAKKWFLENINLSAITHYSTIDGKNNMVTKAVYSLLHTISHMMIISAGKHSGLSRDSISEIIFANTCSIFIFPTSSEGITLGSLSGMFETELSLFLEDSLKENEICTFDPVCLKNQNGACVACAYLSEVNCTHFNKDLSRSYLYGGIIKKNDDKIEIKKGFWK